MRVLLCESVTKSFGDNCVNLETSDLTLTVRHERGVEQLLKSTLHVLIYYTVKILYTI